MKKTLTGIALALMIGLGAVTAPTTAYAGGYDPEVDCTSAGFGTGRALTNSDHINMDIAQDGRKFQLNAYVDRNVPGGFDTLGIRINGHGSIPLTEAQVKAGALVFDYSSYLSSKKAFTVEWAQFNSSYFNQDRNPSKFLNCEGDVVVPEKPEPIVTVTHKDTVNCETKVVTRTETTERTDWKLVDNVWVKDVPVITTTTSERPANTVDCPLPEIPDVGVNTAGLLWTLGGGLLMVGAGTALAVKRRRA
jgi:hypothetical protein